MSTAIISTVQAEILKQLLLDGRKSAAEIAETIGISKEVVSENYLEMKQAGIIKGATIHFNYRGFGYFAVANLLITTDGTQVSQMGEYIKKMKSLYSVYTCGAKGNFRVVAILKNLKQLNEINDELKKRFTVLSLKSVIWTDVKEMHQNLLLTPDEKSLEKKQTETKPKHQASRKTKSKFDEVDLKIVDILSADGRAHFNKIAEKVGITNNNAKKRYENLKKNGMIKATIQIDPEKIGYNALIVFYVTFSHQADSNATMEKISQIPDIVSIMKTSGDYDLQIYAMIRNLDQLLKIQDKFAEIDGITRIEMDISRMLNTWPTPRQYISTF